MDLRRTHRDWFERDPGYRGYVRALRPAGSSGATILRIDQPPGLYTREGASEYSLNLIEGEHKSATATYGGAIIRARVLSDAVALAPPNADLAYDNEGWIGGLILLLPSTWVERTFAGMDLADSRASFGKLHAGVQQSPFLHALGRAMWAEASGASAHGALFVDLSLELLLLSLRRLADEAAPSPLSRGGLASWQERRTTEFLASHLHEDVSLNQLADVAGLSSFHFARQFKQSTGLPPHAYLRRLRCERAKELLAGTGLSVGEIAAAVGYETPQAFARMFRAEVGTSPSEYRRERRS